MSKMQDDQRAVIRYNLRKLRDIKVYPNISKLLTKPLKATLKDILEFAADHPPIIDYERMTAAYMISNVTLTHTVRNKKSETAEETTSRHFNMLCAMGLFEKIPQSAQNYKALVQANKAFLKKAKVKHPVNVFIIPRWTREHLEAAEKNAVRLLAASVTVSNISDIALQAAELYDMSNSAFPNNDKQAIERQRPYFKLIAELIGQFISDNGYCTRQNIMDNLTGMKQKLIKRVLKNFKGDLETLYRFHKPTEEERIRFNLPDNKYIYTARSAKEKES